MLFKICIIFIYLNLYLLNISKTFTVVVRTNGKIKIRLDYINIKSILQSTFYVLRLVLLKIKYFRGKTKVVYQQKK